MDVMAIDWSGRAAGDRRTIWLAHVRDGTLFKLENGQCRGEIIDDLIESKDRFDRLVIGLDFAFSLPVWFIRRRGVESVYQLWRLVGAEGEQWLSSCAWPFWGRPGRQRPDLPEHFRLTERPMERDEGIQAKSVFQIGGAGAVGTGSIRGMPFLAHLHDAGFSIWPFDEPGWPCVIEIYPRLLTGAVRKSDQQAREEYLRATHWLLPPDLLGRAVSSEDAFDAAVSALVLSDKASQLKSPSQKASDPQTALEGSIWRPS